ncbi:MAG: gamma carbonic anhydrase family protein [Burkholderiales bacterium]
MTVDMVSPLSDLAAACTPQVNCVAAILAPEHGGTTDIIIKRHPIHVSDPNQTLIYCLGDRKVVTKGDFWVADNAVVIGSVVLEHNASVWFGTVVRGDNDLITIGECSNIQDNSVLHTDEGIKLSIGRNVSVGHHAMLHGCTIGEGSLVGIKATILNNARIGKQCLIGAHSLITEDKEIPDRSLVVGVPGKVIRQLTDQEVQFLLWNAEHYVHNFQRYKKDLKQQK